MSKDTKKGKDDVRTFDSLSNKELKHILNVKMTQFDKEKKEYINRRIDASLEKFQFIEIVAEYVEEKEIESFLLKPDPLSNKSRKKDQLAKDAQEKVKFDTYTCLSTLFQLLVLICFIHSKKNSKRIQKVGDVT